KFAQSKDGNLLGLFNMPLTEQKSIIIKKFNMMVMKIIIILFILLWIVYPVSATFNITTQEGSFPFLVGAEIPGAVYVNDIDNDGMGEIVVATYKNLYLYNASTDNLQSISSLAGAHHTITKMPDPNAGNLAGDSKLEIVFGDKTSKKLYAWNSYGTPVSGFPLTLAGNIYSTPALADVDNDGYSEIAIGCDENLVYLVNGNGTISTNWPVAIGGGVHSQPAFGDIDGDGELEIVVTALDNKVYAFNVDGSNVSGWPQSISSFGVTFLYNSPAVGDLDNDGTDEVVVSASVIDNLFEGRLIAFNGDGSILWNAQTYYNAYSSPAIDNIDTDAEKEIVVGCVYSVFAFEHDGTPKWTNSIGENEVYSKPLLKDITGDGISEVFVALKSGTIYGWYGDGSSFMQESSGGNVLGTPSLYDFDGDGILEVIVGTSAGYIYAWNVEFIPVYPTASIILPADGSLFVIGDTITLVGNGTDQDGAIITSTWISDLNGVLGSGDTLNVDSSGLNAGYHNISYTVYDRDGLSDNSSIRIKLGVKPVTSILSPGDGSSALQWTNLTFNATANDQDGTINSVKWVSDLDGELSKNNVFYYQDLSIGEHNITFTATDNDGLNTSSQISITIEEPKPPFCQIIKPLTNSNFSHGDAIDFEGSSSDTDGYITGVEWHSNLDGYFGNNTSFSISNLSSGTHIISFNVVDDDKLTWTDQVIITVKGGWGGGHTGEDFDNIAVTEYVSQYVLNQKTIFYKFKNVDPIVSIQFTALRSAGMINAVVEVLHDTSTMVSGPAPHNVYKNVNIFVGLQGYANEQNIRDAKINFFVEKDWIESGEIDDSTISLNKYDNDRDIWIEQPTQRVLEDSTHIYYSAHVKNFSSFAITGQKWHEAAPSATKDADDGLENEKPQTSTEDNNNLGDLAGALLVSIIIILLFLRQYKKNTK
ncbi:MAG: PGF-pre-PGF domain-containing protein, partial [ANME-2 cluster archaeon]|nr:PGF-pre-PGF domain-containing protein [ANME-2 cluster archaeon]